MHGPSRWKLLQLYGIPNKLVSHVKFITEGSKSCVNIGLEHIDLLEIATSEGQGDASSPFLFSIVIDYTLGNLQQFEDGSRFTDPNILNGLAYGHHFWLLAEMMILSSR